MIWVRAPDVQTHQSSLPHTINKRRIARNKQMGEGLTAQCDRHPFEPSEIKESDFAELMSQGKISTSAGQWRAFQCCSRLCRVRFAKLQF